MFQYKNRNVFNNYSIFSVLLILCLSVPAVTFAKKGEAPKAAAGPLETMSRMKKKLPSLDEDEKYDSDTEYANHQKVNKAFFHRDTRNKIARAAIAQFKKERAKEKPLSRISLDGLSSRTRILMMQGLIEAANGKPLAIRFCFNGKNFDLDLTPTKDQPWNGIIRGIGKYKKIAPVLDSYTDKSNLNVAKDFLKARAKTKQGYHSPDFYNDSDDEPLVWEEKGESVDWRLLSVLIDFEVARRLQGIGTYDQVPVASAIAGALQLIAKGKKKWNKFFEAPYAKITYFGAVWPYGKWNVFEGEAGRREEATRRIIKAVRGGKKAKNASREAIKDEYYEAFGGQSESEDEVVEKKPVKKKVAKKK